MLEVIAGIVTLVISILGGLAAHFKVQRDIEKAKRADAEQKAKQAEQEASTNKKITESVLKAAEDASKIKGRVDEIVKRPRRDFFE